MAMHVCFMARIRIYPTSGVPSSRRYITDFDKRREVFRDGVVTLHMHRREIYDKWPNTSRQGTRCCRDGTNALTGEEQRLQ